MKIKVNFRVTGMYFGRNTAFDNDAVIVEVDEKPTVLDLLVAAKKLVDNKTFPTIDSFDFCDSTNLQSITAKYNVAPHARRNLGTYTMKEEIIGNKSLVFQYYIYDQDFKQLNNNNRTRAFNQAPDAEIKDQYSVVIRQIVILNNSEEASELV